MIEKWLDWLVGWNREQEESASIRRRILIMLMATAVLTCFLVAGINIINGRPISNILLPAGLGAVVAGLFVVARKETCRYPVKIIFLLILSVIYVPVAWLASPGSSSAMPLYTLAILTATILLIEHVAEYLIPMFLLIEVLFLYHYEALHPERFLPYTDRYYHAFDLSINFTIIAIVFVVLLSIVNRSFSREHRQLYEISMTDQLTGTFNRRYLYQQLEVVHNYSTRNHLPYSVIMIDVNHFKKVNDQYGHLEGDKLLKNMGVCLKEACRNYDIVVRYGGDEFLVVLPNTRSEEAAVVVERIHQAFKGVASRYPDIPLSLAIGTAENLEREFETVLHQVDDELYRRKYEMKK